MSPADLYGPPRVITPPSPELTLSEVVGAARAGAGDGGARADRGDAADITPVARHRVATPPAGVERADRPDVGLAALEAVLDGLAGHLPATNPLPLDFAERRRLLDRAWALSRACPVCVPPLTRKGAHL